MSNDNTIDHQDDTDAATVEEPTKAAEEGAAGPAEELDPGNDTVIDTGAVE